MINKKEELELIPSEEKVIQLNTIQRKPYVREQYKTEEIELPGREIVRESFV